MRAVIALAGFALAAAHAGSHTHTHTHTHGHTHTHTHDHTATHTATMVPVPAFNNVIAAAVANALGANASPASFFNAIALVNNATDQRAAQAAFFGALNANQATYAVSEECLAACFQGTVDTGRGVLANGCLNCLANGLRQGRGTSVALCPNVAGTVAQVECLVAAICHNRISRATHDCVIAGRLVDCPACPKSSSKKGLLGLLGLLGIIPLSCLSLCSLWLLCCRKKKQAVPVATFVPMESSVCMPVGCDAAYPVGCEAGFGTFAQPTFAQPAFGQPAFGAAPVLP